MEWLLTIYYLICFCLNFLCIHDIEKCSFSLFLLRSPDINYCTNSICLNGGTCSDGVKTFTCGCSAGFTGDKCETSKLVVQCLL